MNYTVLLEQDARRYPEVSGWEKDARPLISKIFWGEGREAWVIAAKGGVTVAVWETEGDGYYVAAPSDKLTLMYEYYLELDFPTQVSAEIFMRGMEVPENFETLIKIGFMVLPKK